MQFGRSNLSPVANNLIDRVSVLFGEAEVCEGEGACDVAGDRRGGLFVFPSPVTAHALTLPLLLQDAIASVPTLNEDVQRSAPQNLFGLEARITAVESLCAAAGATCTCRPCAREATDAWLPSPLPSAFSP